MSILTKPISFKRDRTAATAEVPPPAPAEGPAPEQGPAPKAKKVKASATPQFALSPRANLLPPEITQNQRKRATRRGLRIMVIGALAVVLGASVLTWYLAVQAEARLTTAQDETAALGVERLEFSDVANTLTAIQEGEAAQRVGGSTEIDWSAYLLELQRQLPGDVTLTTVTIDSATATTPYPQSEIPLEGQRIATLAFSADSPVLPSIPDWIDRLSALPGFADASPGNVDFADGVYSASVTMHINTEAYSDRFAPTEEEQQ
jgi:Tfp pilus assembly protein PilN